MTMLSKPKKWSELLVRLLAAKGEEMKRRAVEADGTAHLPGHARQSRAEQSKACDDGPEQGQ